MNSGLIANRYAKAFLEFANAHGNARAVYEQVRTILSLMGRLPKFRVALTDARAVSLQKKEELLRASFPGEALSEEILSLLRLMHRNSRVEFFNLVLLDYLTLYREYNNMEMVQITTATDDPAMVDRILSSVREDNGKTPLVNHKVDPEILGGFIYESWEKRLDASVRGQLEKVREELTVKHRRLV